MDKNIDKAIENAAANVEIETGDISKQTLSEIKNYLLSELTSKKNRRILSKEKKGNKDGKSK